jgi:hypothetical protein
VEALWKTIQLNSVLGGIKQFNPLTEFPNFLEIDRGIKNSTLRKNKGERKMARIIIDKYIHRKRRADVLVLNENGEDSVQQITFTNFPNVVYLDGILFNVTRPFDGEFFLREKLAESVILGKTVTFQRDGEAYQLFDIE